MATFLWKPFYFWSHGDHMCSDSKTHSSRPTKWSRNPCLCLRQCKDTKFLLHRLFQLWSQLSVCGSAIGFSVNVGSARVIKTGLRSNKQDNVFDVSAFRWQDTKWCPVTFGNSSASLRMCQLKIKFLINYALCPCWSRTELSSASKYLPLQISWADRVTTNLWVFK